MPSGASEVTSVCKAAKNKQAGKMSGELRNVFLI